MGGVNYYDFLESFGKENLTNGIDYSRILIVLGGKYNEKNVIFSRTYGSSGGWQ